MAKVLYVDDEEENLIVFKTVFHKYYEVFTAQSAREAKLLLQEYTFDLAISDQRMPEISGVDLLADILKTYPRVQRILVTGFSDVDTIIQAINKGNIFYYVSKPWDPKALKVIMDRAIEAGTLRSDNEKLIQELTLTNKRLIERNQHLMDASDEIKKLKLRLEVENQYLKKEISKIVDDPIIYGSKLFSEVMRNAQLVAPTQSTVLILGETGTGKELMAREIHRLSSRSEKNFIRVNCAAIPVNLIESELFGHVKGAFTGAINNKIGLFELANEGTLFLDEIGELPMDLQSKLLRVLQEGEFNRVGDNKTLRVDVRIVAATNRNLEKAVEKNQFRSDLYFRLNVFPVYCPRLAQRIEDLPALVDHFIEKHSKKVGKSISKIPRETISALSLYDWPGNIRELENFVERAIILSEDGVLGLAGWRPLTWKSENENDINHSLQEAERKHIIRILDQTGWKLTGKGGASEVMGMKSSTLFSKMKKLGIVNRKQLNKRQS